MRAQLVAGVVALLLAVAAGAQDFYQGRFRRSAVPRFPTAESFDGSFNFCRIFYTSDRTEYGGQGWWTDYPDADRNFMIRLSELTKDDALFECPFATIEDAGTAALTDAEVGRLREYLLKGGFLWVDDFWGPEAWDQWTTELARVLPPDKYPVIDLQPGHPLFRMMFEIARVPQIPSIQHWRRSGGETSERGFESEVVHVRGVADARGRVMVLMTHNTDIADAWEREAEDPRFFYLFSPEGYAVGINVLLYSMTH
jgi:hypothetical protein